MKWVRLKFYHKVNLTSRIFLLPHQSFTAGIFSVYLSGFIQQQTQECISYSSSLMLTNLLPFSSNRSHFVSLSQILIDGNATAKWKHLIRWNIKGESCFKSMVTHSLPAHRWITSLQQMSRLQFIGNTGNRKDTRQKIPEFSPKHYQTY